MNISEISIRKPVFAWMLMAGLIIFGGISFKRMGVSLLPDIDFPFVNISLTLDGADPELMEVDVVDPIESAIMSIQGVTNVSSTSKIGTANITVEFDLNKNVDVAVQEIQNAITRVQKQLPKGMDPPSVTKTNPEDNPILWMAVSSDTMAAPQLMGLVRDQLKDRFATLPGVGEVVLGGYVDPNLRVWISADKLRRFQLTVNDVISTIQDEHSELPSGRIETIDKEYNIRTLAEATTAEAFGKLAINKRGGTPNFIPIALNQVSDVESGLADVRRKSRSMGKAAIGLGIRKQRGANSVDVGKAVKERMEVVQKELPKGVEIGVRSDATKFVKEAVNELNFTLALSALLTALVCWIFLGSWSSTINVVMAIPTSVIGTFIVLYAMGFTLNTFTLLGLSLAIGIVVDDAIMVLENIVRHAEHGKSRFMAAIIGSKEITFAALAATAAIIAIFLPIAFMSGIIGKFLYQFGVTLSVAVALSLLEALTLTPMRCSQFLSVGERHSFIGRAVEGAFYHSAEVYRKILHVILRHRVVTILASLVFFGLTFGLSKYIKKEFVPAQDQSQLLLRLQAPVGSALDYTDKRTAEVEKFLLSRHEVHQYYAAIGGFGGGDVNTAMIFVTLKPPRERGKNPLTHKDITQMQFADDIRNELAKFKDLKISVQDLSLSAFSGKRGYPVEFTIKGPNWQTLIDLTGQMTAAMSKTGLMQDVDTDYRPGLSEYRVIPDREKARQRGVSVTDIDQTISTLFGGLVAGRFSINGHRNDVRVRLQMGDRQNATDIQKLYVRNNRGELVPMSDICKIEEHPSLLNISRQNRERAISVYANVATTSSQAVAIAEVQKLSRDIMPAGYRIEVSGSAQTFKESMQSLVFALLMGILVAYMVLASQFNSFMDPLTVLMALPFSISGAFIALYLGHQSLNIYSMIGLVLLMGIVKKNSILLVDFTNQVRRSEGIDKNAALLKACPVRLRPILMTSFATLAGAIPPALAIGPGAESRIPMALSLLGGVFVSTFLTLLVVPAVYSLFTRKNIGTTDEYTGEEVHGATQTQLHTP